MMYVSRFNCPSNGKSVIVEYADNEMHVLNTETNYQACTNFYLTPSNKYGVGEGQGRYDLLMTTLEKQKGIESAEDSMKLLESVKLVDELDQKSGILYNTQWSSIYNNAQKSLDICIGMDYEKTYHLAFNEEN